MSNLGKVLSRLVLRTRATNFDQYMTLYKTPVNPKIVIFGPYNDLFNQVINKHFTGFRTLTIDNLQKQGITAENDIVDTVAQNMVSVDETFNDGYFIHNFPKNVAQAERLDKLLDGVNLALNIQLPKDVKQKLKGNYLECLTCGQLFNNELDSTLPQVPGTVDKCDKPQKCNIVESATDLVAKEDGYNNEYKEVLDFYEKRGLLLNFIVEEHWSFVEVIDRLKNEILANIKL